MKKITIIVGCLLFAASPAFAHHCEDSPPGVTEKGSYDHGKKYGVHTCAPRSKKLGLSPKNCVPVFDANKKMFCQ